MKDDRRLMQAEIIQNLIASLYITEDDAGGIDELVKVGFMEKDFYDLKNLCVKLLRALEKAP